MWIGWLRGIPLASPEDIIVEVSRDHSVTHAFVVVEGAERMRPEDFAIRVLQRRGFEAFSAEVMFWNMFGEVLRCAFAEPTEAVSLPEFAEWIEETPDLLPVYMRAFESWAQRRLEWGHGYWVPPLAMDLLPAGLCVTRSLPSPVVARIVGFIHAEGWARGFPDLVVRDLGAGIAEREGFAFAEVKAGRDREQPTQRHVRDFLTNELGLRYLVVRIVETEDSAKSAAAAGAKMRRSTRRAQYQQLYADLGALLGMPFRQEPDLRFIALQVLSGPDIARVLSLLIDGQSRRAAGVAAGLIWRTIDRLEDSRVIAEIGRIEDPYYPARTAGLRAALLASYRERVRANVLTGA